MKTRLTILVLLFAACTLFIATALRASGDDEISLFDYKGKPVAYIAEDRTIYLWEGKPVAYVDGQNKRALDIYGFNGKHLGWFMAGIIYDSDGNAVGGIKEAFKEPTQIEPFKGFKEFKPFKNFKELRPLQPVFTKQWSELPLKYFLREGLNSD